MLDIRYVRENPDRVKEFSKQKGYDIDVDHVLKLDDERRELQQKTDQLRTERNSIAEAMKQSGVDTLDIPSFLRKQAD